MSGDRFQNLVAHFSSQLCDEHEREVANLRAENNRLRSELTRVAELARSSLVRESQLQDQLEQATQAQAAEAQAAYVQHAQAVAQAQAAAQAHVHQAQQRAHLMKDAVNQLSHSLQSLSPNELAQQAVSIIGPASSPGSCREVPIEVHGGRGEGYQQSQWHTSSQAPNSMHYNSSALPTSANFQPSGPMPSGQPHLSGAQGPQMPYMMGPNTGPLTSNQMR
mmetsp:Transcript_69586/g.109849  ORF Transcript_69586/g.109849 Transcript_69586/m.109849 type:complete len:221 (-) Transcript_69586:180-842(-)